MADTDLAARLEKCYSGAVFDVLRERGITDTVVAKEIRPLDDSLIMAGPVFTVSGSIKPELDDDATLTAWTEFLSLAPAGAVVTCAGNSEDLALMGELSAETLQFRKVRGYLTDAGCRDCAFIKRIGFPVFSRFFTPRDIVGAWTPDAFGEPIQLGGVTISPGDFVIGDIDGVVVIPGNIAEEVVAATETVMQTENMVRKAILDGVDPKEAYQRHGRF